MHSGYQSLHPRIIVYHILTNITIGVEVPPFVGKSFQWIRILCPFIFLWVLFMRPQCTNYRVQTLFWVQYLIGMEVLTAGSSDDYEVGTNLVGTKFDMKQKQSDIHEKNRHKNLISKHKPFIALWYAWFITIHISSIYYCNNSYHS